MNAEIEFAVAGIVEGASGLLRVIGRCGDAPVRVGDVFESVFRYSYHSDPDGAEIAEPEGGRPIQLKIELIQAYGRDLKELSQGMTGSLALSGAGSELVEAGSVLGSEHPTVKKASSIFAVVAPANPVESKS